MTDIYFMQQAIDLAHLAEKDGNLPVGSLITLKDKVVAEGPSRVYQPRILILLVMQKWKLSAICRLSSGEKQRIWSFTQLFLLA